MWGGLMQFWGAEDKPTWSPLPRHYAETDLTWLTPRKGKGLAGWPGCVWP